MAHLTTIQSILGLMISSLLFMQGNVSAAETAGKVVSVSGKVLIRNENDKVPQMKFLKPGDLLLAGTILNTDSSASAKLLMTDKTILDLGGSTLFKVRDYQLKNGADRNVDLEMDYGKVRASVNTPVSANGKFTIKTKAASMGVRGTEFIVGAALNTESASERKSDPKNPKNGAKAAKDTTTITVISGKVEVKSESAPKSAQPTAVHAGEQITAVKNLNAAGDAVRLPASEAPAVVKLSASEMKEARSTAVVADRTFSQSVTMETSSSTSGGGAANGGNTRALAEAANAIANAAPPEIPTVIATIGVPDINRTTFVTPIFIPKTSANLHIRISF